MFTVCQALTHFISFNPRNSPLGEVLELVPFIGEETEHIEINNLPKVQSGDVLPALEPVAVSPEPPH